MARMTDLSAALEDVYTRDSQASSVEIRKHGETKPTQHCKKCGNIGHRASNCSGSSRSYKQKFVDLDSLDPNYKAKSVEVREVNPDTLDPLSKVRDKSADPDSSGEESELEFEEDFEDLLTHDPGVAETPRKSVSFAPTSNILLFDETVTKNDSPAKRTRSRQKSIPIKGGDPTPPLDPNSNDATGRRQARRKLDIG